MKKLLLILAIATAMVACQPSYADTKIQLQQTFGTGTSTTTPLGGVDDAAKVYQAYAAAGERNEDSTTGTDYNSISQECKSSGEIDLSSGSGTVYAGPALICGFMISTTIGTAASSIDDNSTAKIPLPVSFPVGVYQAFGTIIATSIKYTRGASGTGKFVVFYRPLDTGVTW